MLNAARVVVGSPSRARNAFTIECEIWCSSVVRISGAKNRSAVRMVMGACETMRLSCASGNRSRP